MNCLERPCFFLNARRYIPLRHVLEFVLVHEEGKSLNIKELSSPRDLPLFYIERSLKFEIPQFWRLLHIPRLSILQWVISEWKASDERLRERFRPSLSLA